MPVPLLRVACVCAAAAAPTSEYDKALFAAEVSLPRASTVMFGIFAPELPYVPAVTPEFDKAIVPVVVIGLALNVKPLPLVSVPDVPGPIDVMPAPVPVANLTHWLPSQ